MKFAPRISPRLVLVVERLAAGDSSAAEICRRTGDVAEQLGLTRPSYQLVRVLVNEARRAPTGRSADEALAAIAYPFRPPTILWSRPRKRRRRRQ